MKKPTMAETSVETAFLIEGLLAARQYLPWINTGGAKSLREESRIFGVRRVGLVSPRT